MKEKEIAYFKGVLNDWLKQLMHTANSALTDLIQASDLSPELIDRADAEMSREFRLRIRERQNRLTRKIMIALDNIENGSFGVCEECGEDIPINRLKVRPITTYCVECKNKIEAAERLAS
ncbi:MAG: TraR/DksA family transcriptional regulator [Desulfobacteraceae bacterium]|nr:MAG: TraR/DksA family transcriptional regulator [Desulfobacteraceae bacterium]